MGLVRYIENRFGPSLNAPLTLVNEAGKRLHPHEIGEIGERLAAKYLRRQRFKILHRNFKPDRGGEVDLVARDKHTLVFVEVKTRTSLEYGRPIDAVDKEKQRYIAKGALKWLSLLGNPPDIIFRFDVVEVILRHNKPPEIQLIREAFSLPEPYLY